MRTKEDRKKEDQRGHATGGPRGMHSRRTKGDGQQEDQGGPAVGELRGVHGMSTNGGERKEDQEGVDDRRTKRGTGAKSPD